MAALALGSVLVAGEAARPVVAGIHPHLAAFNGMGECGIGAVVPWADRLWFLTYPPHASKGSPDKLYSVGADLSLTVHPESVGGTHANRLIHRESKQLIIGPYFIDERGAVRVADISKLVGRLTATARHISDPANKVFFYDMEGAVYEVDVRSLAVTKLFPKPVPGAHGKGAYSGQGVLVVSNNGEKGGKGEDAGVLAEWDGTDWKVILRRQFTDITGPGGIHGATRDDDPLWAIGWDRRSVLLLLRDRGAWHTFRMAKASHAFDPRHGWFTEWPRIRQAAADRWLLDMHGMFHVFPPGFRLGATGGIRPLASHLRYVPDFCDWNGALVLAADDASTMQNPMAGQSQSNLWFGRIDDLRGFGPAIGSGGPWVRDPVRADEPSQPFLIAGFDRRVVHCAHDADTAVTFTLEVDADGSGAWTSAGAIAVPAKGYAWRALPRDLAAEWLRVRVDRACTATAYLHCSIAGSGAAPDQKPFAGLADVDATGAVDAALVRPAGHNRNLQVLTAGATPAYREIDETLRVVAGDTDRSAEMASVLAMKPVFSVDAASVLIVDRQRRWRLPKGDAAFDALPPYRALREAQSERNLANIHGTFYEVPREDGWSQLKPVCSHRKRIHDFCSWRGLLVLSGCRSDAAGDGRCFGDGRGATLWFGHVDDLWKLGAPRGEGGPWKDTAVEAGAPSDPYLMTGYNGKRLSLRHDRDAPIAFTVEVDVDHSGWHRYATFDVAPGQTLEHVFPEGYSAHWLRVRAAAACTATAWLVYTP